MESAGFRSVVSNFTQLNPQEAGELEKLAEQHPYSQLIHLLRARSARDLKQANAEEQLHRAAVYATDRAVLKHIMTTPPVPRQEPAVKETIAEVPISASVVHQEIPVNKPIDQAELPAPNPLKSLPAAEPMAKVASTDLSGDALREDIYLELEKLKKSKHDFEASVEAFAHGEVLPAKRVSPRVNRDPIDPLLDEIKTTKKKVPVQNPKAQEQNEIIEEFIRKEPVLPKPVAQAPAKDLAEDSSLFTDNIVSETLVEILLKQGKKEKAIEVLKKLIWKFPQKKAYFAAQIESLKS
jgi:tetratricopeptide (TPR) repeat protein